MQITEALQNLGLNEKEARVYVALLKLGRGSAYAVADEAGLKKPTTYVILGELMLKGLANKIPRVKKQLFVAKPPDELFAVAEEKVKIARNILPQLLAIAEGEKLKVRTLYYEGLRGARELLWHRIKEMKGKEFAGFYAAEFDVPEGLAELFHEYNNVLKKLGITIRGIAPEHPSLARYRGADAEYGRNMKIIPCEDYSANISIDIGDTFVRILAFRELQGVVIENPDVARTMRQIFEMVWQSRKEPEHDSAQEQAAVR